MAQLEQTMQLYHIIYLGCLVMTLLFLTITIVLAVRWRIWEAVGILSGKVATKAISENKVKQKNSKKSKDAGKNTPEADVTTEKLWYREAQQNPPLGSADAVAGQNATVLLQQEQNATVLLQQPQNGTVLLDAANQQNFGKTEYLQESENVQQIVWQMQILDEIIEIHSQEKM